MRNKYRKIRETLTIWTPGNIYSSTGISDVNIALVRPDRFCPIAGVEGLVF